jgi:hypothetical protein
MDATTCVLCHYLCLKSRDYLGDLRNDEKMKINTNYSVNLYGPTRNGEHGIEPWVSHRTREISCQTERLRATFKT